MKLKVILLMAGILFATTNLNGLFAQSSQMEVATKKSDRIEIGNYDKFDSKESNSEATIHAKALKNFERNYKNIQDRTWSHTQNGYMVKFQLNCETNKAYYDNRGKWIATSKEYGEDKLSEPVRDLVKRNYYNFDIKSIVEITTNETIAFIILLEGKKSWVRLRVMDDDIHVLENFEKS